MFALYHSSEMRKVLVRKFDTYEGAYNHAESLFGKVSYIEEDPDHPGMFDAFMESGNIICIETEKAA